MTPPITPAAKAIADDEWFKATHNANYSVREAVLRAAQRGIEHGAALGALPPPASDAPFADRQRDGRAETI